MTTININNYSVQFPYETPYNIQIAYMSKVLSCLDGKQHGVLESPTGTGKTLCLFAPVSAWMRKKKEQYIEERTDIHPQKSSSEDSCVESLPNSWVKKRGKVWYTARTHSQIAQTVSEVRRCNIQGLHIRVMGARDQLCINQQVLDEKDSYVKTVKCKELTKSRGCKFYNKLNYEKDSYKFYQAGEVMDIEDLVSAGKSCGICPYFMAKKANESADIVLLPYNYIIDKDSREANGFMLNDDVVIFDEGHNVPSTCEESYEFTFTSLDVALGISNVKDLMQHLSKMSEVTSTEEDEIDLAKHAHNSMFMLNVLQRLEAELDKLPMSNDLLPVSSLYDYFSRAGVDSTTSYRLTTGIEDFKQDSVKLSLSGSILSTFYLLEKMMNVVFGPTVRSFDKAVVESSFKFGITVDADRAAKSKKLSLYCFNPSFGVKSLLQLGVQSIIITSGTLSPLRTFIHELSLPEPISLENGHIASKAQVPFAILGTGVNNVKMDATFNNRKNPAYVFALGMTLTNLISSVPDGVLLLFSSYSMMQNLRDSWEADNGIWARLESLKRIFVEPRGKDDFINCMENYKRAVDSGNGAVLMGVLRGKVSEGMDFKDQYCRAVFIVGVPFPPVNDPRVKGKQDYSNTLIIDNPVTRRSEKLYNNSFSSVEAMKATNQAIGRVIRHGGDYGAIILVDLRFAWPRQFHNISGWIRDSAPAEKNFPETKRMLRDFFRSVHQGRLGVPEVVCQRVDGNGCPVASHVSYEEYDHKKAVRTPAPWISAPSTSQLERAALDRSSVTYLEDDEDDKGEDLMSSYKNLGTVGHSGTQSVQTSSCLDALDTSSNTSLAYREFDVGSEGSNKRKCSQVDDLLVSSPKSSCMIVEETPPSARTTIRFKKVNLHGLKRLQVKPLTPSIAGEPESVDLNRLKTAPTASGFNYLESISVNPVRLTQEEIKVKLINYFQEAKQLLSEEQGRDFKSCSWQYMKGEIPLLDTLDHLDRILPEQTSTRRVLFPGFGICIKSKDLEEWKKACQVRNLGLS